jgi:hypothetical protein
MTAWKHRGGGHWDLRPIVCAIVAIYAATDICGIQGFAPTLGLSA